MQKRAAQTRNRILQSAMVCFSRYGYASCGVADICNEAGVSKGAFYHHFSSKQEVFVELIHHWLATVDAKLQLARSDHLDVPVALLQMSGLVDQVIQQASDSLPAFLEIWLQASREPEVRDTLVTPYGRFQSFFADVIRSGIERGSFEEMDASLSASALLSLAVGLLLQSLLAPEKHDWAQVSREGFRIFIRGMSRSVSNDPGTEPAIDAESTGNR